VKYFYFPCQINDDLQEQWQYIWQDSEEADKLKSPQQGIKFPHLTGGQFGHVYQRPQEHPNTLTYNSTFRNFS
jgi:hypothetical protein